MTTIQDLPRPWGAKCPQCGYATNGQHPCPRCGARRSPVLNATQTQRASGSDGHSLASKALSAIVP